MDIITLALAKKYAEEAGGEITPNPTGEPTATLEKIQIGDTIYSLPAGGGENGSRDIHILTTPTVTEVTS